MGLFHEPLSDELQNQLLQTLLQRAQSALSEPSQVEDAMNASEMAYDVYKRHGSQLRDRALLWGYYGSETSLKLRPTLSPANQVKMVDRLADVIDVDPSKMDQQLANDYVIHRNRAADDIDDWKRVRPPTYTALYRSHVSLSKGYPDFQRSTVEGGHPIIESRPPKGCARCKLIELLDLHKFAVQGYTWLEAR